jgi:DNA polymerase-4
VVIGGGRRHQPQRQADGSRRFATLADYTGRGVITTATYAARDLACTRHGADEGRGALPAGRAAADRLRAVPRLLAAFKAAVAEVAPLIEDRGIDEIYIDLSELPGAQEAVGHDPWAACARWRRRSATTCAAPPA